ncbi:exodeoxyribonuclease VII small subunit [Intestinibacillus massiliensis]|uniref:exodeoxyribonuclease VII small subunit n=1 Tax=Intestinibacillus massiliensis TaxID=1871029 RepID=UPI000B3599A7|nr:exodeoxyribonuclease VII small subunit [Intestinibacillus massiliensis]MCB6364605.1 exodeoxyribonuclease VII small subunit [Intestinibacillus massiliensis]
MKKKQGFEEAMQRLEQIVRQLEHGDTTLEESMKLFEEGMKLSAALGKQLDTAEQKVTLMLKDEAGEPVGQAFSPEGNDNEI